MDEQPHYHQRDTITPANRPQKQSAGDAFMSLFDRPAAWIDSVIYKFNHIPETNFRIAKEMFDAGKFRDAILRLRIALWFAPQHQQAYYLLGACYVAEEEQAKAADALANALQLDPTDARAAFMLAVIDPSRLGSAPYPTTMPPGMALEYFASNAATYEMMQADAGYKGHQLTDITLWDTLDPRRVDYRVLELGCGTGLCGTLLAERCEEIIGVDFCKEMIDLAKAKRRPNKRRVYTENILQDMRYYMADRRQQQFDAIIAAHVFNYVGDLTVIFDGVAASLNEGGAFIFQVEIFEAHQGYGLVPLLGRFGHSHTYIQAQCARVGLRIAEYDKVRVYPDYEMMQYVVRR